MSKNCQGGLRAKLDYFLWVLWCKKCWQTAINSPVKTSLTKLTLERGLRKVLFYMIVQNPQYTELSVSNTSAVPLVWKSYLFLSCLEGTLLTVDLAILGHHLGLSSGVSSCETSPITSSPALMDDIRCYRSREHCGSEIHDNMLTTGCLSLKIASVFRAEAVSFILLSRYLLNVCYINKYFWTSGGS